MLGFQLDAWDYVTFASLAVVAYRVRHPALPDLGPPRPARHRAQSPGGGSGQRAIIPAMNGS